MENQPVNKIPKTMTSLRRMELEEHPNGDKYLLIVLNGGRDEDPIYHIKLEEGRPELLSNEEA